MSEQTYVSAVLSGRALADDIDDWIDRWHADTSDTSEVHDYLGMTWAEYQLWTEQPSALRWILAARKRDESVGTVQVVGTLAAAAARSSNESEAARVVEWLRRTGRIAEA